MEDNCSLDNALFRSFFKKSQDYYMERLERFQEGEKYIFNKYAFFFGFFWMFYRKMYLEAILSLLLIGIFDIFISSFFNVNTGLDRFLNLVYASILGFSANYMYILKSKRSIERSKQKYLQDEDRISYLNKKGGVTYIVPIIFLVTCVLIYMIGDDLKYLD